jgi:succinate dehydrogenase hydrophobic anchor subunit
MVSPVHRMPLQYSDAGVVWSKHWMQWVVCTRALLIHGGVGFLFVSEDYIRSVDYSGFPFLSVQPPYFLKQNLIQILTKSILNPF